MRIYSPSYKLFHFLEKAYRKTSLQFLWVLLVYLAQYWINHTDVAEREWGGLFCLLPRSRNIMREYSLSLQSISKSAPLPASLTSHDEEEHTSHFLPETKSVLCDVKICPDIQNTAISDHYLFSQNKNKTLVFGVFFPKAVVWAKNSVL